MTQKHNLHPPSDFGYQFHNRPPKTHAKKRLITVIWLNVVMMIAEIIGGLWTNSLALLSDAGHMLTHIFALVVSYIAIQLAGRENTAEKTYGYYRAEPIGAVINGITILLIVVVILIEAVKKLIVPEPIQAREMFVVAVAGLIVNLLGAVILRESAKDDINIKGSFVHLLTDTLSSIAIVAGGAVIIWTGWELIDPLLSLVICVVIGVWGVRLLVESFHILLDATPKHIALADLSATVRAVGGVVDIHDIHVWEISSGMYAMTCHVQVADMALSETERIKDNINAAISDSYGIGHSNLQFEVAPSETAGPASEDH